MTNIPNTPKNPEDDPSFRDILLSLGIDPDETYDDLLPENLAILPKDQWQEFMEIIPPPAIRRYLESGDVLSNHTIDMMEMAMEKAFGVEDPWYITSMRDGMEEDGDLSARYFYLGREVENKSHPTGGDGD